MLKNLFFLFSFFFFLLPFQTSAFSVSPSRIEVSGNPGETIHHDIVLENKKEAVKTYSVSFENFRLKGDSGIPQFVGSDYGLATWILVPDEPITIPGDETILPLSISIPETAIPGGYFSAVFFEDGPLSDNLQSIDEKVGVLVFLRVNGEIQEGGQITSFELANKKRLISSTPFEFSYSFNNTGGDRIIPRGTITILNSFQSNIGEFDANPKKNNALPKNERKFDVSILGDVNIEQDISKQNFLSAVHSQLQDFRFGPYTAKLEIIWGEQNSIEYEKILFFVFPWQILSLAAILAVVLYKLVSIGIKRYNKKVLSATGRLSD